MAIDPDQYDTVSRAARVTGVARSTLQSAVERGEVELILLAGGTRIVRIDDVRAWIAQGADRRPGPNVKRDSRDTQCAAP
mgnify:CR=1 FL=1